MFIDAGPLVGVLRDLNIHEDKIQAVLDALTDGEVDLSDSSFAQFARIPPASFGGSPVGHQLGDHHNRAQQVFTETIEGVTKDLGKFRDGVRQAVSLVTAADQSSADDLNRKREIAEGLQSVWQNSEGERAYHRGRNQFGRGNDDLGSQGGDD
jgi:hypothetical protein